MGKQALFLNAVFLGHHRRNQVWILSWDLVGDAAKSFRRISCGRVELWVPFSARRLLDLGQIFHRSFFPDCAGHPRKTSEKAGWFLCLTCSLRRGMRPWGPKT